MKHNWLPLIAVVVALASMALVLYDHHSFEARVQRAVEKREEEQVKESAFYINETRKLTGLPPKNPKNYKEAVNAMLEGVGKMVDGITTGEGN